MVEEISKKIYGERINLYKSFADKGNLLHPEVQAISRELDELILNYMKECKKENVYI